MMLVIDDRPTPTGTTITTITDGDTTGTTTGPQSNPSCSQTAKRGGRVDLPTLAANQHNLHHNQRSPQAPRSSTTAAAGRRRTSTSPTAIVI